MVHDPKLTAIDLNLLVVLRALLNERHVTRAARELGLSQSATSHALARLRELYADPLLVRNGRSLELTPRAAALLPQVERGLSELQGSLRAQEQFDPLRARFAVRIGTADYGQAILSGPLLELLRAEAPGVNLQATSYPEVFEQLEVGTLDFALVTKTKLPRTLLEQRLFSDGFVCMLRRGHPALKKRRRVSLAQYLELEHLLVSPGGTPGSYVDTELGRRGHARRVALQVSSFLVAPQVVAETDLISTGPERLLRRMSKHYPVALSAPPLAIPRFELCLIWHARREHDPAHAWMRSVIVRAAEGL